MGIIKSVVIISIILAVVLVGYCYLSGIAGKISGMISGGVVVSDICECASCSECTEKLNDNSCKEVRLTQDIIGQYGTCIDNPGDFNYKIFDCQGHLIRGKNMGYGIYLDIKNNNIIKNCKIENFYRGVFINIGRSNRLLNNRIKDCVEQGIYLDSSIRNVLEDNSLRRNKYGIKILGGYNNELRRNVVCGNLKFDVYVYDSSPNEFEDNYCDEYSEIGLCQDVCKNYECEENWVCDDWGECVGGKKRRKCVDLNECESESDKPKEVGECGVGVELSPEEMSRFKIWKIKISCKLLNLGNKEKYEECLREMLG